jgi:hypothetical protein
MSVAYHCLLDAWHIYVKYVYANQKEVRYTNIYINFVQNNTPESPTRYQWRVCVLEIDFNLHLQDKVMSKCMHIDIPLNGITANWKQMC